MEIRPSFVPTGAIVRATRTRDRTTSAASAPPAEVSTRRSSDRARAACKASSRRLGPGRSITSTRAPPRDHRRAPGAMGAPSGGLVAITVTSALRMALDARALWRPTNQRPTPARASAVPGAASLPAGRDAQERATFATHHSRARVGRWATSAYGSPTTPATAPAAAPHTITGATAGAASTLATIETTGTPPNAPTSIGATPTCAAIVVPAASRSHAGPGSRRAIGDAIVAMPTHAATDSWNPTARTSRGSARSAPVTARASTRKRDAGRPSVPERRLIAAIALARSTDGSQRVMTPKAARTTSAAASRGHSRSRRRAGAAMASTKATFCPLTARR